MNNKLMTPGQIVGIIIGSLILVAINPILVWLCVQPLGLHPTILVCYAVEALLLLVAINVSVGIVLLRPSPEPPIPNRHGSQKL